MKYVDRYIDKLFITDQLYVVACITFTEAVRHSSCMDFAHTQDRTIEVVIKNWLRGSADLVGW